MSSILKRLVMSGLGVVVMLGYWTLRGPGKSDDPSVTSGTIPTKVFGGGGGHITIEAELNAPGVVAVSFETRNPIDDQSHKYISTWQQVPQGTHSFTIDVPAQVGGSIDVRMDNPTVGAEASVRLKANGATVGEDTQKLTEPLPEGYGFSAQLQFDDYITGAPSTD